MLANGSQYFSASYDLTTKIISTAACVVFGLIFLATMNTIVAVVCAAVIVVSYAYSPRGYTISNGRVAVKRLLGNADVPLDGVREVRRATADDFMGGIRLFGDGGLFGYYGLFRTSKLGKCTWYVTNRSNAVVMVTSAKTYIFSPDDADGFIAAVRPPLVSGTQPAEVLGGSLSSGLASQMPKLIVALIVIAGIAFALFSIFYSPGLPSYTITPDSLTIHDHFYPVTVKAADVDIAHIRIVDIDTDPDWRPTARTNGFANARYHSGWFRVANGQTVHLYRADGRLLVLLPPLGKAQAVLLETADPQKFVDELRQKWSAHS